MQLRERKLHGGLDADGAFDAASSRLRGDGLQQLGLADPASPRSTSTERCPTRMRCSSPSSAALSSRRPRSIQS
jgi:hypothetical protein